MAIASVTVYSRRCDNIITKYRVYQAPIHQAILALIGWWMQMISSMAHCQQVYFRGPHGKIRKCTKSDMGSRGLVYFSMAVTESISSSHHVASIKVLLCLNSVIKHSEAQMGDTLVIHELLICQILGAFSTWVNVYQLFFERNTEWLNMYYTNKSLMQSSHTIFLLVFGSSHADLGSTLAGAMEVICVHRPNESPGQCCPVHWSLHHDRDRSSSSSL